MPIRTVENRGPRHRGLLGSYRARHADGVRRAIRRSRAAQGGWASPPLPPALPLPRARRRGHSGRADELAAIISANSGKTSVDALATEIVPAVLALRFYRPRGDAFSAEEIGRRKHPHVQQTQSPPSGALRRRRRHLALELPLLPSPSPRSRWPSSPERRPAQGSADSLAVGRALADCFAGAGLPDGLFAYVNLPGREAAVGLHGGVDKLFLPARPR